MFLTMNVKRKPDIDEVKMGTNPFILNQIIKAKALNTGKSIIIQTDEGVNLPVGTIKDMQVLEEQAFTKLYHDVDYRKIIMKLSHNALRLYVYITYKIETNHDYLWINNVHFQEEINCTKKQYMEAIHELVRYGVVTPTIYVEVYFINPMIFFCGNRLKKYPEQVKIRE